MKLSHHLETSNFQGERDLTDLNALVRHSGVLLFITLCIKTAVCFRNRSDKDSFPYRGANIWILSLNLKNSELQVKAVASAIPNPVVFMIFRFGYL